MSPEEQKSQCDGDSDIVHLVEFLATRDVACPLCGYNLRGLTRDICPECGRQLQLSVGLTDPFLRAWAILAVAMFSAGGLGVLFIYVTIKGRLFPDHLWVPALYFMLAIPGSAAILLMRRRFLTLTKTKQFGIAWTMMVITAVAYAILFGMMY